MSDQSSRTERIIERIRAIREGYVTTHELPWHRVVRADGTIPQGRPQRELLLAEGVPMRGDRVDLKQARLPPEL